jgi:hypothetical protein
MSEHESTRRELLKKAAYVPPAILTLAAIPSFASAGSESSRTVTGRRIAEEERHQSDNWLDGLLDAIGLK